MTLSAQALDFLFENRIKDNKEWYKEHKQLHQELVINPFKEFIVNMEPYINKIDPTLECNPKKISRIYRDTRFSKDKTTFRDNVWCMFMHGRELYDGMPGFFFDFSPRGFSYGCGYYKASTKSMQSIRELILNKDKTYTKARKAYDKQCVFDIVGDSYKKNHFPEQSKKDCDWLNRKSICFITNNTDYGLLFSEELAERVGNDFLLLKPMYEFMMKAELNNRNN